MAEKETEEQTNLESLVEINETKTSWSDIGGCIDAKKYLQRLSTEINHPEISERWGGKPPKGILLSGPEGTGKTLLAKAFATSTDSELWKIKGADIGSKYVNESANNIKHLFEAAKTKVLNEGVTIVIYIDEFDSIARNRGSGGDSGSREDAKVVNAINVYLDGLDALDKIYIIATTNRVDTLDPSVIRPGRFDRHIEVGNPNYEERKEIYQIHVNHVKNEAKIAAFEKEIDYEILSKHSEDFNGAKIAEMVKRARDTKKWYEYETEKYAKKISTQDILNEIKQDAGRELKKEPFGFAAGVKQKNE